MPINLIRSLHNINPNARGGVLTIGNFDGVHVGHQALINQMTALAAQENIPSIVMTFEPHPFEFFSRGQVTIPRITRFREKFFHLSHCGINHITVLPFNQKLASLSASDFIALLHDTLQPKHIIIGDDFRFGYKRQGDIHLFKKEGERLGFSVRAMETVSLDNERISSTRVRAALGAGDLAKVQQLLGRPYSMLGRVRHGDQLGRQLGFPTANIFLHRQLTPFWGIYTVYVHGLGDKPLPGAANVGIRPTVDGTRCLLEVHLLDFNQDIYGRDVEVEFCKKLHDEVRYPNLELLKEHIAQDVLEAKAYFNNRK